MINSGVSYYVVVFFFVWLQNKFDFLSKENRRIFVSIRNYLDNKVLRN